MRKQAREDKKALRELSAVVSVNIKLLDEAMGEPESKERGQKIAAILNGLDMVNDSVRYFHLGVDYRKDKKK